jgi:ribose transport system ATP-binding protein
LPQTPVKQLSVAHQQMVEIAKALAKNPSVLILDEPTASITQKEVDVLFTIIRDLKGKGVAIVYISHRLQEIFAIADRVSVLKDGKYIGTKPVNETTSDELIRMMVGRDIQALKKTNHTSGEVVLEVKNLSGRNFKNISFHLHRGEIVGFAGLVGSGRTEIARAIFGADTYTSGTISIRGTTQHIHHTNAGIAAGIAYLPEERKTSGVFLDMTIEENVVSADLSAANENNFFSHASMTQIAKDNIQKFGIAAYSPKQPVRNLSGGNQQKVVLAKWLLLNSDTLIVDEPTHGVDVGAKFEIYELLQQQAANGKAILLISSDMPELLMLSDTIYVLYKGTITKKLRREEATEEKIMHYAAGVE